MRAPLRFGAALGASLLAATTLCPPPAVADSFRSDQWYLKTLQITQAHKITSGSGITVAVVDSGAYPHQDLRRNLLAGVDLVPGEKGDGRTDKAGHGTNIAAIIGAHGRNDRDGILGIAPAAKLLPIKITNSNTSAPATLMGNGIEWATSHGAKVINVSAETGPAFELIDAVNSAIQNDIVVVAGVGNTSGQAIIAYPAAIDGVLVIGAIGRNGRHASLSVTDRKIDVCAPGVEITTAEPNNKYVDIRGTSASTAIASGAAALVRAKFPHLSGEEVIHRLTATADDIGPPGRDDECGFGRLNVLKALTADVPPLEGAASSATTPASTAPAAADTTSPATAFAPRAESKDRSAVVVLGGLGGVAVALGVLAFLSLRRRRNF